MIELTKTLDELEQRVHRFSTDSIRSLGDKYKNNPIQFFRVAPLDSNLRIKSWMVTFEHQDHVTTKLGIGVTAGRETKGTLRITVAVPGSAVKDTSTEVFMDGDNWGQQGSGFVSREAERRADQVIGRTIINDISEKFENLKSYNMVITGYNVSSNQPQIVNQKYCLYPVTTLVSWKHWWDAPRASS